MDMNWKAMHLNEEDLKDTVTTIHAYSQRMPVNHWTIFLELPFGQSVRVDMNPLGYGNKFLRGQILVSSKTYRYTQKTMRTLSFPTKGKTVVKNMTKDESVLEDTTKAKPAVQDVIDLINDNGLQEYTFSSESGGCRYWVYTVILHLEREGMLDPGNAEELWQAISVFYMPSDVITNEGDIWFTALERIVRCRVGVALESRRRWLSPRKAQDVRVRHGY
ncbi:hypothetical protein E4U25_007406 [Claviceps purpurea]|nr:hypothetical protein E4U25_007406 [Claviceps purpurea]